MIFTVGHVACVAAGAGSHTPIKTAHVVEVLGQASVDRAYTMQEVWVATESVRVLRDHHLSLLALLILLPPFLGIVRALRRLQLIEQHLVFVNNLGQAANPVSTVQ